MSRKYNIKECLELYSCRSQMAEGWLRHEAEDRFEVFSAGTRPTSVHPLAIQQNFCEQMFSS